MKFSGFSRYVGKWEFSVTFSTRIVTYYFPFVKGFFNFFRKNLKNSVASVASNISAECKVLSAELRVCEKFNSEFVMCNSELSELRWQLYNCL